MRSIGTATLLACLGLAGTTWAGGGANWSVGVSVGSPGYYRPHYGYGYYPYPYYRPWAPVYVAPAPIYVAPPPVVVQQPPTVIQQAVPTEPTLPAPTPLPPTSRPGDIQPYLRNLTNTNEGVRIDTVTQLGRSKSDQAIDPLAATLSGDQSPAVREAAARALGVIGSNKGLPALTRAAQTDADRDVRRSAQFAVEIIQSH